LLYGTMKVAIGGPLKVAFRPWVEGLENIPAEGPAILASNHLSFSDSFFLPAVLDRKVTFIAKAEYFTTPGIKGRLTAAFFKGVGQLPVDRSGARGAGEAAIQSGLEVLARGELFGIYPEGTRSPDGRLYRGKPGGLARVALASGAPVVPVAMIDTEKIQPPGKVMPKLMRPGIRIGKPLDFSRYQGMEHDRFVLRAVTDEVMYEIMKLSGQEYVDIYATAAKRQIAEATKAGKEAEKAAKAALAQAEKEKAAAAAAAADEAEADTSVAGEPAAVEVEAGESAAGKAAAGAVQADGSATDDATAGALQAGESAADDAAAGAAHAETAAADKPAADAAAAARRELPTDTPAAPTPPSGTPAALKPSADTPAHTPSADTPAEADRQKSGS